MSEGVIIQILDPEDAEREIVAGALRARTEHAHTITIVFGERVRPQRELVETLTASLQDLRELTEVRFVSTSSAIAFMASAVSLRLPRLRTRVLTPMEHETLEENRSSPDPASPSSASLPVVIDIDPAQAITPQLSRAFARFAGHDVGVLRFAPDRPIPRELVPLLDRYMPTSVQLAKLVLIHPSATAGFIASTLALRHPRVQIAAATQWTDPTSVR